MKRFTSLLALLATVLLMSCGAGYQPNDQLVRKGSNEVIGLVTEVGTHSFPNGLTVESLCYKPVNSTELVWVSLDVVRSEFEIHKRTP